MEQGTERISQELKADWIFWLQEGWPPVHQPAGYREIIVGADLLCW